MKPEPDPEPKPKPKPTMVLIGDIDREALADPARREAELDCLALAIFRAVEGRDPEA